MSSSVAALCVSLWLCFCNRSDSLAIVGYVPDYRYANFPWDNVVSATTHLILFSLEPQEDATLGGLQHLRNILHPDSTLIRALRKVKVPPKLLVTIGGAAGRSKAMAAVAGSRKLRKKLVKEVTGVLSSYPRIDGIDLDWEEPQGMEQWRDLGRIASDLRQAAANSGRHNLLLTMAYHPRTGAVATFSQLRGQKTDKNFVELFDICHAMAYSQMDHSRRHSFKATDEAAIQEWTEAGLPLSKLTLGIPFFGVSSAGKPLAFNEIIQAEPSLWQQPEQERTKDGVYFVNRAAISEKVVLAGQKGLAGVMIWELGQDAHTQEGSLLLGHIWKMSQGSFESFWSFLPAGMNEDNVFVTLAAVVGGYYFILVLLGKSKPASYKQQPEKHHK